MINEIILIAAAVVVVSPLLVGLSCNIYRTVQMIWHPSRFKSWFK